MSEEVVVTADTIEPPQKKVGIVKVAGVLGILGGIGAAPENLIFMKETADKLFGDDYRWSVLGAGRHQMPLITQAAMMGGNVRVGLEDNLYIGAGQLARSNAEQVAKIRRIIEELGLAIATPDEAREWIDAGDVPELAAHQALEMVDIDSGHWPMISRPAELAAMIARIADSA